MSLQEIYQEVLLAHNEHPNNFFEMPNAASSAHGHNPLCGDEISVFLDLDGNRLKQISFTGQSCAICKSSASLMTEYLKGKTAEVAKKDALAFIELLNHPEQAVSGDLGELEALLGVRKFPARLKCATLAWHTFLKALEHPNDGSSASESCSCKHNCCC